ncbi:hypothetical protein ACJZ2D_000833 [Fusarium nematophilum]
MAESDPEVVVAVVALIVSLVALAATFMQVMQQYYASAAGYAQCDQKVMGKWSETRSRRFRLDELRYEVEFDAPVIFVSPPSNEFGPIRDSKIYLLEGTKENLEETWTELITNPRDEFAKKSEKDRIHTADNERASWTLLLSAVQQMEHDSRIWQQKQYDEVTREVGPPNERVLGYGLPSEPPTLKKDHTLTVALQRKRKSWDTMPVTISRPYATTTICHLVEMTAALGIYWKEFDRKHDRYRAEGNGFMVLGEKVADLGLMFTFSIYGKNRFDSNRVIPVDQVKELCFGYASTVYRWTLDQRRLAFAEDDPQNLAFLQLATRNDISETLIRIGCNNNAVRAFKDPGKHTSHLFPVSFEILGMLARTFHIKNSVFTYIPNPTPDRWEKRSVFLTKVMEAYWDLVPRKLEKADRNIIVINRIKEHIERILDHADKESVAQRMCLLRALHEAIDDCDQVLTARGSGPAGTPGPDTLKNAEKKQLGEPDQEAETERQTKRREQVQDVLRSHIQEVLRLLNESGEERTSDTHSLHTEYHSPITQRYDGGDPIMMPNRFEDMHDASPEDRQHKFMEVYFFLVRPYVVRRATSSTVRRNSQSGGAPPGFGLRKTPTGRTMASSIRIPERATTPPPPRGGRLGGRVRGRVGVQGRVPGKAERPGGVARRCVVHAHLPDDMLAYAA